MNLFEVRTSRDLLLSVFEQIQGVSTRRDTLPALSHALIEIEQGDLRVTATDLEVLLKLHVRSEAMSEGRLCVPSKKLYELLKALPSGSFVSIKSQGPHAFELTCNDGRWLLPSLPSEGFPSFKASPQGNLCQGQMRSSELSRLVQKLQSFVLEDNHGHQPLSALCLDMCRSGGLRGVATDGTRLAVLDLPDAKELSLDGPRLLPMRGMIELKRLCDLSPDPIVSVQTDRHLARFKTKNWTFWIRALEGEFPLYSSLLSHRKSPQLRAPRQGLRNLLRSMEALSQDGFSSLKLDIEGDRLWASLPPSPLGEARDALRLGFPAESSTLSISLNINGRYLKEALACFESENIDLFLPGEPTSPCWIESLEEPDFRVAIAQLRPMRPT